MKTRHADAETCVPKVRGNRNQSMADATSDGPPRHLCCNPAYHYQVTVLLEAAA
jgi:hypothetical protein